MPLTPALSLREREKTRPAPGRPIKKGETLRRAVPHPSGIREEQPGRPLSLQGEG